MDSADIHEHSQDGNANDMPSCMFAASKDSPVIPPSDVPEIPSLDFDTVTSSLSMAGFSNRYVQVVASGQYRNLAMWYIDIRNFRSINPNYGYRVGNTVLRVLASKIKEVLTHELPVARLGADRFVPITADIDFEEALVRFYRLIAETETELKAEGINYNLVLSAGIYYLRPSDLRNPNFQQSLDFVSIAHRNARQEARSNLVQFTDEDLERDIRRMAIEQSIDDALETGQIEVWYQPQVDYIYGEVVGAEALARWNHPDLGWISPTEFIPALESCGRIHDLDLYVWEEACRNAGRWRNAADGKPVPISVNVSRSEMFKPGLMDHFLELQRKYDLPDGSLRLEVTESAFVEEADRLYKVIEAMRSHNMIVEMDDFGSGLSSLVMLKDVPVDVVKLDMAFMRSTMNEDRGGVVLGSIIRMLQGLDTPIIAEGVETMEQAEMLKNMGCHLMQGFHFSRPMPLKDFESFISSNHAVEHAARRLRIDSHIDDLTSLCSTSSFLFNHAIGGSLFFYVGEGMTESIVVNDKFYEECGLDRKSFGDAKVNPIAEIEVASQATLWRAAAEAREHGAALCRAEVRRTGRWFEGVLRFVGSSSRGDVYFLNIVRSGATAEKNGQAIQIAQDVMWNVDLVNQIVPNGFIKCDLTDALPFNYINPLLSDASGLSTQEFIRRFHNSFIETILPEDRSDFLDAVRLASYTEKSFSYDLRLHHGYGSAWRDAHVIGRVKADEDGKQWLYALVLLTSEVYAAGGAATPAKGNNTNILEFDFVLADDKLTLHAPMPDGTTRDMVFEDWLKTIESRNDYITNASATKVLATVRDLYHHPIAGFCDVKTNLRAGNELRWYHINYTCDADEDGNLCAVHGYAQDANDQRGSARWWRTQAETDQLTGLLNRNAAEQEINLAMRTQGSGMMFMVDLDGFKRVNDELGHLTGDALLRDVATALRGNFREGDVLGRYGGDEFVAFVPIMGGDAHRLAKRRSLSIIDSICAIRVSDGTHAACSVGVAISHDRRATFYDLLKVADNAMYHSKERGKGTFTVLDME